MKPAEIVIGALALLATLAGIALLATLGQALAR